MDSQWNCMCCTLVLVLMGRWDHCTICGISSQNIMSRHLSDLLLFWRISNPSMSMCCGEAPQWCIWHHITSLLRTNMTLTQHPSPLYYTLLCLCLCATSAPYYILFHSMIFCSILSSGSRHDIMYSTTSHHFPLLTFLPHSIIDKEQSGINLTC